MPHGKLRLLIEEPRFTHELARIIEDAHRADEFVEGAKWLLAHDPQSGRQIGNSPVWFLPMKEMPDLLPIVIYYTFDDEHVNLLSIQETLYPAE